MVEKLFNAGDVIFRQGDQETTFYQIKEGTVGIFLNYGTPEEITLTQLKKGQFFGEMAAIETRMRSADAVCCEDGTVVEVYTDDELDSFIKENPENAILIIEHLGERLRELTDDYDDVTDTIDEMCTLVTNEKSLPLMERVKKHLSFYAGVKAGKKKSVETLRAQGDASRYQGRSENIEKYPAGTVIFKQGETGNCMYSVEWGRVQIISEWNTPQEELLTTLYPNAFFGEMGMISELPRSATAIALDDDTVVEIISMEDLRRMFNENPPKAYAVLAHLSSRLRQLTADYTKACEFVYKVYGKM